MSENSRSKKQLQAEIVMSGAWKYNNEVEFGVWIVKQNWDEFYDPGFEDEPEKLNENGDVFHVEFGKDSHSFSTASACYSLEEAVSLAQARVPNAIDWHNRNLGPVTLPKSSSNRVIFKARVD